MLMLQIVQTSYMAAVGIDQSEVAQLVQAIIILLLVATIVALLSRRLRLPYVTGLVIAGLAIAQVLPRKIGLDSSLIINLFLPILLFEAAINTDLSRLQSTLKPIVLLAGPGIMIAAGPTALGLKFGLNLEWIPALLGGVILAVTDTVSVVAVFKQISVPARLITIVEGESLFNDGVVLVLFSLLVKISQTGSITAIDGLRELLIVVIGGLAIGFALGYVGIGLYKQSAADPLSSILITFALALSTFQVGQFFGVSGSVAVVITGLMMGNLERSPSISASSRITVLSFWEYAGFAVNTFIFLLIGLEIKLETLSQILPAIVLAVICYQVGRGLAVYPLMAIVGQFDRSVPLKWQHTLFFGNIKGSLSMALVLSLPSSIPGREQLVAIIFGAVLVSLLIQGVGLPWIIEQLQLNLAKSTPWVDQVQSQLITGKAAQEELDSLLKTGLLSKTRYEELRASYQIRIATAERSLRDFYNQRDRHSDAKLDTIKRQLLLAEKGALSEAARKRVLAEDVIKSRLSAIDAQLLELEDD
jgi:monovalent cation:H+ antiporter, CPA1 family